MFSSIFDCMKKAFGIQDILFVKASFIFRIHCVCKLHLARMLVPKMVKNGFNSVLQTSAGSRRLVAQGIQEQIRRPKTALKS